MQKKAWAGRFKEKNDPLFEKMNKSLFYDIRLYKEDILLNKVFSEELSRIGIISKKELSLIKKGLNELEKEIASNGEKLFTDDIEDIHIGIENLLTQKIGDAAKKMHSGKSRNDQIATDVRMYLKKEVDIILIILKDFMSAICKLSEKNTDIIMPGFTHFRQAQPVLFSHYILSFFFSLERDYGRLKDCVKRISIMPLGSAALAGTSYPLDREKLRESLGFDTISSNSMDGVSSRDFMLEFLSDISILSITLSRFAEDFIIFSGEHFNFFELSDKVTTGSSIMPNKKNPDSLELTRGKTGRIIGNLVGLFMVLKALPSTYNKDLQEDKEKLFDTVDSIKEIIKVNTILLETIKVNKENMIKSIDPLSFATELADYLALNKVPFREAHHITGKIVSDCIDGNIKLTSLSQQDLCKYHKNFKGIGDDWGNIQRFLERRNTPGGTGLNSVHQQIRYAKKFLKSL